MIYNRPIRNVLIGYSILLLTFVVGVSGCSINKSLSGRNISQFYQPGNDSEKVIFSIIHQSPEKTGVRLFIDQNALEQSPNEQDVMVSNYSIRYRLFSSYSSTVPLDSGNIIRKDRDITNKGSVDDSLFLNTSVGYNYVLECVIRDFNSGALYRFYEDVLRSRPFNNQTFRLFTPEGAELLQKTVNKADSYDVVTTFPVEELNVLYYDRSFPIASPPFSVINPKPFDFNPDRVTKAKRLGDNRFRIIVDKEGFYQLTLDAEEYNGATIFFFDPFFPKPKTLLSLVEPLRYISTNEEFEAMIASENMKKSVDAHWLKIGDNPSRAKELIKAYYSRVQYANELFTSYLEGWKSDRGMCYIVFGPPDIVYRSTSAETWMYGEEGRYNSLSLTFTKVVNPFSSSDFRLNRSTSLRNPWYRAVEFWRQGRVLTYR